MIPPPVTSEICNQRAAMTGIGGHVISDGTRAELAEYTEETPTADVGLNGGSAPDPEELSFFGDVRSYLPLRNMMEEEWPAAAHATIDAAVESQPTLPDGHLSKFEKGLRSNGNEWPSNTSTSSRIVGEIHRSRIGEVSLSHTYCEMRHLPLAGREALVVGPTKEGKYTAFH